MARELHIEEWRERYKAFSEWVEETGNYRLVLDHVSDYLCPQEKHYYTARVEDLPLVDCPVCTGDYKEWSAFYVVLNPITSVIKLGISNGIARNRLADHRGAGYTCVIRLLVSADKKSATALETDMLDTLRRNQVNPLWGREYFPVTALPIVLEMIDNNASVLQRGFTSYLV